MVTAADIVTAILAVYPYMSGNNRQCIIEHRPQIEQVLTEAQQRYPNMPIEFLAAIGFIETHLGCDQGEGGNWGAPISPTQRHIAGTPMQAATSLWHSFEVCRTMDGAARRFRTGVCANTPTGTRYANIAMSLVSRIRARVPNTNSHRTTNIQLCASNIRRCLSI